MSAKQLLGIASMVAVLLVCGASALLADAPCVPPQFTVHWKSYQEADLVITASRPYLLDEVKIFPMQQDEGVAGRLAKDPNLPTVQIGNVVGDEKSAILWWVAPARDPYRAMERTVETLPLDFSGKPGSARRDQLQNVYAANGFVAIYFKGVPEDRADDDDVCPAINGIGFTQPILERHMLSIDAGSVLALDNEGKWTTQPEIAIAAKSRWRSWLTGYVDLRYSYVAAIDETEPGEDGDDDDDNPPATKADAGNDATGSDENPNPFESGGGVLRGNLYLAVQPNGKPAFSLPVGVGFSTRSDPDNVKAPVRYFAGVRWDVRAYNVQQGADALGNTTGFVQVGFAHDDFWEWTETVPSATAGVEPTKVHMDERERWFVEAQLKLPNNSGSVAFSPRVFADIPTSGDGPADIRVSILAKISLDKFTGLFPTRAGG
jgi:hypothetical protein